MCVYKCVVNVFCYKKKMAYVMRISDWSSDVCSYDLPHHRRRCQCLREPGRADADRLAARGGRGDRGGAADRGEGADDHRERPRVARGGDRQAVAGMAEARPARPQPRVEPGSMKLRDLLRVVSGSGLEAWTILFRPTLGRAHVCTLRPDGSRDRLVVDEHAVAFRDRKSTRLNSSH